MTLDFETGMVDEDQSWTPVKNVKKERYADRKRREAQEQLEKAQAGAEAFSEFRDDSEQNSTINDFTEISPDAVAWNTNSSKQSAPTTQSQSTNGAKRRTKPKRAPKATSAEELITLLSDLIMREFRHEMQVAELGAKLTEHTGASWNKVYKQSYGTLITFLQKNPETFATADGRVVLRSKMPVEEKEASSPRVASSSAKAAASATPKKRDAKKQKKSKKSSNKSNSNGIAKGAKSLKSQAGAVRKSSAGASWQGLVLVSLATAVVAGSAAFYVRQHPSVQADAQRMVESLLGRLF